MGVGVDGLRSTMSDGCNVAEQTHAAMWRTLVGPSHVARCAGTLLATMSNGVVSLQRKHTRPHDERLLGMARPGVACGRYIIGCALLFGRMRALVTTNRSRLQDELTCCTL